MVTSERESIKILSDGLYYSEILTDRVQNVLTSQGVSAGFVHLMIQHTTSALMLVEQEAGIFMDIKTVLTKLVPDAERYYHHIRGVDRNGAGHVLSALLNRTLMIPVFDGQMVLGTYQEILFMDFQPEQTDRFVSVTVLGECSQ